MLNDSATFSIGIQLTEEISTQSVSGYKFWHLPSFDSGTFLWNFFISSIFVCFFSFDSLVYFAYFIFAQFFFSSVYHFNNIHTHTSHQYISLKTTISSYISLLFCDHFEWFFCLLLCWSILLCCQSVVRLFKHTAFGLFVFIFEMNTKNICVFLCLFATFHKSKYALCISFKHDNCEQ